MPWVVPGESLHLEMAELREALGSAEAALEAATFVNGRHVAAGEIGVIEPGARADILLVPEDPTVSLDSLRDWRILFSEGRRYDRELVDRWLAEFRSHSRSEPHESVMGTIVDLVVERFAHH